MTPAQKPDADILKPAISGGPRKLSYEEFLIAYDGVFAEWVDGEVVLRMSPVSKRHQQLVVFLTSLLNHFAEARNAGSVLSAPYQMKTGPQLPGREPDVLFVGAENSQRLKNNHLKGPGDLVVEIISPDSRTRDRKEKFAEYEQGGVREYWLVDPERREAAFFVRGENGRYQPRAPGEDGIYRSAVLDGLWIGVDWLWREPLPAVISVLKEWKLV
jgi:Uma2 family endonuclease